MGHSAQFGSAHDAVPARSQTKLGEHANVDHVVQPLAPTMQD